MVDREARDKMIAAVEAFMEDRIGLNEYADVLTEVEKSTGDETARVICGDLWSFYDDESDEGKITSSKEGWDYLNKARLLLASDDEYIWERRWTIREVMSAFGLACYVVAVVLGLLTQDAWPGPLIIGFTGLASCIVGMFCTRDKNQKLVDFLLPFPSYSSVFSLRRRMPAFRKLPYRPEISSREISRGSSSEWLHWLGFMMALPWWIIVLLLYMAIPVPMSRIVGLANHSDMFPVNPVSEK